MNPNPGQFSNNVKTIPAGSKPLTPPNTKSSVFGSEIKSPSDVIQKPVPVNSSTSDVTYSRHLAGMTREGGYVKAKIDRPKPNQGTVVGPGKILGGENATVKIQPMTIQPGGPSILRTPVAPKIKGQRKNK